MCNQKGGVGKTTTTINLGAALVEAGRKVLLVDFDPQGSMTVGLGFNAHDLEQSIYHVLMDRELGIKDIIMETSVDGLDLAPSNIDLSAAEMRLVTEVGREQALARVLHPVLHDYDVVLIDCQPSLGLLTVNALTASDGVIIPLECEYFALRGVALLKETIEKVRDRTNVAAADHRPARHDVRQPYPARTRSAADAGRGLGRPRVPHRHPPHDQVLRLHGGGGAHHGVRHHVAGCGVVPPAGPRGIESMPRRVNLPGADELFRATAPGEHAAAATDPGPAAGVLERPRQARPRR